MTDDAAFPAMLAALRRERGLSYRAFAAQTTISKAMCIALERGARRPSRETVALIAAALGLDDHQESILLLRAGHSPTPTLTTHIIGALARPRPAPSAGGH